ncbi:putative DD41D transposase [Trichonephila clavipes]|nr:putative DD41D transposase [Trichonephila clavipes]
MVDFHKRILFSDEAHFWLNGYVNKQNCRIWSEANPQVNVETPLHPEKLTVWCALWAGGIIGPYFFKNDEDHNVTVNGDRYRAMIINFFFPELNNNDVQELRQEVVTPIVIPDEMSQSSAEPLRILVVVQNLGNPFNTQKSITDDHELCYDRNVSNQTRCSHALPSMLIRRSCLDCAIVSGVIARWLWPDLGLSL